jgi:CdiI immunity protein
MNARRVRDQFPALHAFLTGYLHEDFVGEHKTPRGASRAFRRDAQPAEQRALEEEAARFIALSAEWPWRDVRHAFSDLGARWAPRSRAALVEFLRKVGAT